MNRREKIKQKMLSTLKGQLQMMRLESEEELHRIPIRIDALNTVIKNHGILLYTEPFILNDQTKDMLAWHGITVVEDQSQGNGYFSNITFKQITKIKHTKRLDALVTLYLGMLFISPITHDTTTYDTRDKMSRAALQPTAVKENTCEL